MDETKKEEPALDNPGEGVQSEADKQVKLLDADTERINKAIAENENAKARQKLNGVAEAGQQPPEKKEETPKEYRNRVEKEMAAGKTNFK